MLKLKKPSDSRSLAKNIALIAEDKLAKNVILLNMTDIENSPSDYFVICTCETENHVRSIGDDIIRASKDYGMGKPRSEGFSNSSWVIIDFFNVVVHIMLEESRNYYKIENLWGDSKFLELNESNRLVKVEKEKLKLLISN